MDGGSDEDSNDDRDVCSATTNRSVCNIALGNFDLGHIVNGFKGDPIEKRPFDYTFTTTNIRKWWEKVGFLPMTRAATKDDKV